MIVANMNTLPPGHASVVALAVAASKTPDIVCKIVARLPFTSMWHITHLRIPNSWKFVYAVGPPSLHVFSRCNPVSSPISFLRLVACLGVLSPRMAPGEPAITAQPASVAVTFPMPLPTTDLSESRFPGAYLLFTPLPGPYPLALPTQWDVLMSRNGNGYTGLGTGGPWF